MAHKNWKAMLPKIEAAFAKLKDQGIRAEMNFSITLTDGISEIWDEQYSGYAFYHEQDTERAEESGELVIAYGSMKNENRSEEDMLAVGRSVKKALEAEGLYVDWLEDPDSRIYVYLNKEAKDEIDNEETGIPTDPEETHDIKTTELKAEAAAKKLKVSGSDILTIEQCNALAKKAGTDVNTALYARGDRQGKPAVRMPYYNVLFDGETNFCMFGGPEEVRLNFAQALKAELEEQGLTVTSTSANLVGFKVPEKSK